MVHRTSQTLPRTELMERAYTFGVQRTLLQVLNLLSVCNAGLMPYHAYKLQSQDSSNKHQYWVFLCTHLTQLRKDRNVSRA